MEPTLFQSILGFVLLVQAFGKQIEDNREICLLPPDEGPCRARLPRYYYNRHTEKCEEFNYGGCEGNANNFANLEHCEKTCWKSRKIGKICRLEPEEGPCRAMFKRYFYNFTAMECQVFIYGGCLGNENRFVDRNVCRNYCEPQKKTPSVCNGPVDQGTCSSSIRRYYYNPIIKSCVEFLYTGCGGNANNFATKQSCKSICMKV
ncbi:tissue factor pathway inhibitor 2-like [Polyodon spathula]|uniref:tissue factor pathway inhibitor 2-like n=1 Tax=Polyodon spathula TaxID=7913 RepID=UPI001B7E78AF|nr:tissue factor pathway inhibitor 2-like isoform X2 [Polyodon spathula]XP_041099126.1 tissue factor pathway inhibitor 2-like [Polyodon spathula]